MAFLTSDVGLFYLWDVEYIPASYLLAEYCLK
jgi:hypothetical protein